LITQSDIIYFLLTDRFCDGDPENNFEVDHRNPCAYHGGDFRGIKEKIPYLKNLGVNVVWLTRARARSSKTLVFRYNNVPNRIGKAPYLSLLQSFCDRPSFLTFQPNMDISRPCILRLSVHSHYNFSYF